MPQSSSSNIVELRHMSKSYHEGQRSRLIFDQLDLAFVEGEFTLLLGQSGSGKSTLLNLISGIDSIDSGEIQVGGEIITRMTERELTRFRREHIGFIFQFFNLIPTLTVFENVTLPLQLTGQLEAAQIKRADELIERVGLQHRRDAFPDRLSGGEQQRVAILRAIIHNPLVLLADEPTGNLDENTGDIVLKLLLELTREAGKTLIMATHNPEIIPMADQVYRVSAGTVTLDNSEHLLIPQMTTATE